MSTKTGRRPIPRLSRQQSDDGDLDGYELAPTAQNLPHRSVESIAPTGSGSNGAVRGIDSGHTSTFTRLRRIGIVDTAVAFMSYSPLLRRHYATPPEASYRALPDVEDDFALSEADDNVDADVRARREGKQTSSKGFLSFGWRQFGGP